MGLNRFSLPVAAAIMMINASLLVQGCLEEERTALLQIKTSIAGPNNTAYPLLHYWGNDAPCCRWPGVSCDDITGRVNEIDLSSLIGLFFDPSTGDWSRDASMGDWYLNATLFLPFQELKTLDLGYNYMACCVPNEGFERLSRLNKLESLDLGSNNFNNSILSSLKGLSSLKHLYLRGNRLNGSIDTKDFDSLSELEELDLSFNEIQNFVTSTGFERPGSLDKLEILDLSSNRISDGNLSFLKGLSSLKQLHLNKNQLKGSMDMKGSERSPGLNKLEILGLSFNKLNDSSLSFLEGLSSLKQLYLDNNQLKGLMDMKDSYRRRVFFNYEKRIRLQSPPEKVFEYFASFKTPDGEVLMTPEDLMRAMVPVFPPSESNRVREGFLRGETVPGKLHCAPSKFFMLFDTNSDGLISFSEYIFFVTLLSIPESSFSVAFKMFDLDNNGQIDREEFKKVMGLMRAQNRQGASHRDGRRFGLKVAEPVENGGLLEYFFGKDGKTCLQHERFVQFLRDLHDEILRLEFAHYDYRSCGTISAKDFALSLVASADINHISKLLDRVDEVSNEPHIKDIRITFEEFKNFAELRRQLQYLSLAIFSYGKVNGVLAKKDFQRASSQVCGISITDDLVDIIFHVFDANRDGNLSSDEFVRVLQGRETAGWIPRDPGLKGLMSCCANCAKNYSSAKRHL